MRKIALFAVAAALAVPAVALADDGTSPTPTPNPTPSPAQSCKLQRKAMGVAAFKDLYGTNHNKRNAFGKCVAKQAHVQKHATDAAKQNAPAKCRAEQAADPAAFAAKYGTNHNKHNAFGTCVSAQAKADGAEAIADHDTATVNAAKTCKAERKADPVAFAAKYGTNHNKRNAFGKCVAKHAHDKAAPTPPPTTTTTTPAPTPAPTA